jgi:hypothetical protein
MYVAGRNLSLVLSACDFAMSASVTVGTRHRPSAIRATFSLLFIWVYVPIRGMNSILTLPAVERLALSLDGLARCVAARIVARVMSAAMIVLVCARVRRAERDIRGLLARFQAGRLRVSAVPRVGRGGGGRTGPRVLPSRFGWLLPLVPGEAACFAGQIRAVLAEPQMEALIAVSPQARRVLRPVCRMLGIERQVLEPRPVESVAASVARLVEGPGAQLVVEPAAELGRWDGYSSKGRARPDVRLE